MDSLYHARGRDSVAQRTEAIQNNFGSCLEIYDAGQTVTEAGWCLVQGVVRVDSLDHTLTGPVAAAQGGGGTQVSAARFGRFLFVRN